MDIYTYDGYVIFDTAICFLNKPVDCEDDYLPFETNHL